MRVEGDRVGELEAVERARPRSVSTAKPPYAASTCSQTFAPAELCELRERIDRAGARRAAVRDDEERQPPRRVVRRRSRRRASPARAAGRRRPAARAPGRAESRASRGRAPDRRVRLVRCVDDEVVAHRADERLARARERRQVGGRAAADERAGGVCRVADPLLEPVEDLELELRRPRRLLPRARVDVARARDEVAERARPRAGERHVREERGCAARLVKGRTSSRSVRERLVERRRGAARAGRAAPPSRPASPPRAAAPVVAQPVDERVDRAVAERAHLLAVERKRIPGVLDGGSMPRTASAHRLRGRASPPRPKSPERSRRRGTSSLSLVRAGSRRDSPRAAAAPARRGDR